jgi:hypothetical protein
MTDEAMQRKSKASSHILPPPSLQLIISQAIMTEKEAILIFVFF